MNNTIPEIKDKLSQLDILLVQADYLIEYQQTVLQQLKVEMKNYEMEYVLISNAETYYENYKKQKENLRLR